MKKSIFLIFALATFMVSCNSNEDLAGTASVSSSTSASIAAYVADNFPATAIVSTAASKSNIIATLNTGETITFTNRGKVMAYSNNSVQGITADSLIVSDSIRIDGEGRHHHRGGHKGHGGHGGPGDGFQGHGPDSLGGFGHPRHFDNEIAVDSLPAAINEYVLANYVGYTVIHAQIDTICQGVVTEVMVCITSKEPVKLVFDATGTFIFSGERILYSAVPTEVSAAVTANYSTYTVKRRAEKFTLADASVQYKVFMDLNKARKSVTFNADGTVACEK